MNEALHVTIEGLVQGVGFRYAMRAQALKLGLSGWVCNLPDGRVEAWAEGPRESLETLLAWCHKGPTLSKVAKLAPTWRDATGEHGAFIITF
jgi:acylphosphatase